MTRLPARLAACIAFGLLLTAGAQASDIACSLTLRQQGARCDDPMFAGAGCRPSPKRPASAAALICEYALLHVQHQRIDAEQKRLLRTGAIQQEDVAAWRRRRDACTTVSCLDRVFAGWRASVRPRPAEKMAAPPRVPEPPELPVRELAKKAPIAHAAPAAIAQPVSPPGAVAIPAPAFQPVAERQPLATMAARPAPEPIPKRTSIHPAQARPPQGWESLGTLAWLGMCSAGLACWSRRMRGEWLPGLTRLRARTRQASPVALCVGGLAALNGVLLACILALR
ncbi:hypothetical protein D9M68_344940 [compost metagenome]